MHKKSVTFGVGVGILAMVALCWFVFGLQKNAWSRAAEKDIARLETRLEEALARVLDLEGREIPTPPPAAAAPPLANAEVERLAKALGMGYAADFERDFTTPEPTDDPEPEPTAAPTPEAIRVVIPEGSGSRAIANILRSSGVIADAAAFDRYMSQKGVTRVMPYGTFDMRKDMTDEDALAILRGGKR